MEVYETCLSLCDEHDMQTVPRRVLATQEEIGELQFTVAGSR